MVETELFEPTTKGRRRSIMFAVAIITGFIGIVATTSVFLTNDPNVVVGAVLGVVSLIVLIFAAMIVQGHFEDLFADESLFWQVSESIEEDEEGDAAEASEATDGGEAEADDDEDESA